MTVVSRFEFSVGDFGDLLYLEQICQSALMCWSICYRWIFSGFFDRMGKGSGNLGNGEKENDKGKG